MGGSIPPPISGHTITASIEPVSAVERTCAVFNGEVDPAVEDAGIRRTVSGLGS
jgi:hypothetical protein